MMVADKDKEYCVFVLILWRQLKRSLQLRCLKENLSCNRNPLMWKNLPDKKYYQYLPVSIIRAVHYFGRIM